MKNHLNRAVYAYMSIYAGSYNTLFGVTRDIGTVWHMEKIL
jgi:hypothetical protein